MTAAKVTTELLVDVPVDSLIPYHTNPRKNAGAINGVKNSLSEFTYVKVSIGIDEDRVLLYGHTTLKAIQKLGWATVPKVLQIIGLTKSQKKAFRIADNRTREIAEWDIELLLAEVTDLKNDGYDATLTGFSDKDLDKLVADAGGENDKGKKAEAKATLSEKFVIPPFSVLDARQGYWQDRKQAWLTLTGNLSETRDGEYGKTGGAMLELINGGTSNFDPVLAEVILRWFCPPKGKVLDPFGGEVTKGYVSGFLGHPYSGMEIRPDQVKINEAQVKEYPHVRYFIGDSKNIATVIKERGFDLCFTSPPYYDLEVYSKGDLSALGTYDEFKGQYAEIIRQCAGMLKDNRFFVIKVGEIRDKKTGEYRNFVGDTITILRECGLHYYNEIALITAVGTARLRAGKYMETRKLAKIHQNVLVFYKGDLEKIKTEMGVITSDVADLSAENDPL